MTTSARTYTTPWGTIHVKIFDLGETFGNVDAFDLQKLLCSDQHLVSPEHSLGNLGAYENAVLRWALLQNSARVRNSPFPERV